MDDEDLHELAALYRDIKREGDQNLRGNFKSVAGQLRNIFISYLKDDNEAKEHQNSLPLTFIFEHERNIPNGVMAFP